MIQKYKTLDKIYEGLESGQEMDGIRGKLKEKFEVNKDLAEGKKVKIISGPFKDMVAKIDTIDMKEQKLNVLVDLFGQETSVEVDIGEVETL